MGMGMGMGMGNWEGRRKKSKRCGELDVLHDLSPPAVGEEFSTDTSSAAEIDQNFSNLELNQQLEVIPRLTIHKTYPTENIIGDVEGGVKTRNKANQ
ncbi:hypothetical protein QVD17_16203 [Tagetes erecta]|uniref:Uncharacterized protein n=1 Tax=Tagetes erecta TaxID=13708 RepID=A0AAD8P0H5_TARER|nr:hypothetical protein QVD17_16203 [Tagetes erecta]